MNHFAKIVIIFTLFQLNVFSSLYTEVKVSVGDFDLVSQVTKENYSSKLARQNLIYQKSLPNNVDAQKSLFTLDENIYVHQNPTLSDELFATEIGVDNQEILYPVTITNFHDTNLNGDLDTSESLRNVYFYIISGTTSSGENYNIENYETNLQEASITIMLPAGQYTIETSIPVPSSDDIYLVNTNDNPKVISIDGSQSSYSLEFGFNFEPTSVTLSDSSTNQSTSLINIFALLSLIFLGSLSLLGLIFLAGKKANLDQAR